MAKPRRASNWLILAKGLGVMAVVAGCAQVISQNSTVILPAPSGAPRAPSRRNSDPPAPKPLPTLSPAQRQAREVAKQQLAQKVTVLIGSKRCTYTWKQL